MPWSGRVGEPHVPYDDDNAPDWVRACNCCECGRWLVGLDGGSLTWLASLQGADAASTLAVCARHRGRPYCKDCWRTPGPTSGVPPRCAGEPSPWQESAVRALEDAPAALEDLEG